MKERPEEAKKATGEIGNAIMPPTAMLHASSVVATGLLDEWGWRSSGSSAAQELPPSSGGSHPFSQPVNEDEMRCSIERQDLARSRNHPPSPYAERTAGLPAIPEPTRSGRPASAPQSGQHDGTKRREQAASVDRHPGGDGRGVPSASMRNRRS